ncbi:procathepsin L-like [Choloepus didactylus]|uniref:procathepsin L-like n=1 Tax=Choloepus didactylus TaxID=27675 RepID=UPI0018A1224F|nr:procathepsin L-like [Choloepus didactylus]
MKMIKIHNLEYSLGQHSFKLGMNAFGDVTSEEFRQMTDGIQNQEPKKGEIFSESPSEVPTSVDWRDKGCVTPVKNQDHCGCCWAFSAAGSLEGQMFQKTGIHVSLSEQNLVDCSQAEGSSGCNGGLMDNAFQYVQDNKGLDSEESYPYIGKDMTCSYKPEYSAANDTGFIEVAPLEKALMVGLAPDLDL